MLLRTKHICKSYAGKQVLDDLKLQLELGQILGLLGTNGADKSTTVQIIGGCLATNTGQTDLNSTDLVNEASVYKQPLGFLPEYPPLYSDLTVLDYLLYTVKKLREIKKVEIKPHVDLAINHCNLTQACHKRIKHLATGYRQRIGTAQAILHRSEFIILAKSTVGLDPVQLEATRTLIHNLSPNNRDMLSIHIWQEVEVYCDTAAFIKKGKVTFHNGLPTIDSLQAVCLETAC